MMQMQEKVWGYFDTSVLVKQYVKEKASQRARHLLRRYRFVSSAVTPLETISALCRRRSMESLSDKDFAKVVSWVQEDRAHWELIELSSAVLDRAEELIQKALLRTLDAIHVASALTFQKASGIRIPFITADVRQSDAAEGLGLDVIRLK